jgi:hypothetical protein
MLSILSAHRRKTRFARFRKAARPLIESLRASWKMPHVQIIAVVSLECNVCNEKLDIEFDRSGPKALHEMSFLDKDFLIEYANFVHNWTLKLDGIAFCPNHKRPTPRIVK